MRCKACYECSDNNGRAVTLCPLHAQAEEMRDLLRKVSRAYDCRADWHTYKDEARALLRASEGRGAK